MNPDFPRIISLLRKEHNISQKQAAADLGVSQALLSHYEKGIRECGLDFLVRAADYYNVSCDYLLGRTPEPSGRVLSFIGNENDLSSEKPIIGKAAEVLLDCAEKTESRTLKEAVNSYLLLSVYKMFRIVFSSNPQNEKHMFSLHESCADKLADAAMNVCAAKASSAASGQTIGEGDKVSVSEKTLITTDSLTKDYPENSMALLTAVKLSEETIASSVLPKKTKEKK